MFPSTLEPSSRPFLPSSASTEVETMMAKTCPRQDRRKRLKAAPWQSNTNARCMCRATCPHGHTYEDTYLHTCTSGFASEYPECRTQPPSPHYPDAYTVRQGYPAYRPCISPYVLYRDISECVGSHTVWSTRSRRITYCPSK